MIPCIYVFRYEGEKREKAIKRLECSVNSFKKQAKIFILNASTSGLYIPDAEIVNKPQYGPFNKAKLINHLVKHCLSKEEWCILADIDIIFEHNYVEKMTEYFRPWPRRMLGYSQGAAHEFYTSNFNEALKNIEEKGITAYNSGIAPGIGLLHIPSFIKIQGYNEDFLEYGPEDAELNKRLATIIPLIENPHIKNVHLWHEPADRNYVKENIAIFEESEKRIKAGDILRNNSKTWGEYD